MSRVYILAVVGTGQPHAGRPEKSEQQCAVRIIQVKALVRRGDGKHPQQVSASAAHSVCPAGIPRTI